MTKTSPPCLVLGASGFIGRNLIVRMAQRGMPVRAMSRTGAPLYQHELIEWVAGDICDQAALDRALDGCGSCVQLATTTKPGSANDDIPFDITSNLISNVRLLDKLADMPGMKFVYISSGGTVYGNPIYVPIKENHPTDPRSSYGITKLAVEKYIAMYSKLHGLNATTLRVSNPFGEYQSYSDGQGVVATFLWKALNGLPIEIWGDGSAVRDYLYVGDVCDAIIAALGYDGGKPVFNIGFGKGLSVLEILKGIEETIGFSTEVRYLPCRPTDVRVSVLDSSLAKSELGWSAQTPLFDALERTADWMAEVAGTDLLRKPVRRKQV